MKRLCCVVLAFLMLLQLGACSAQPQSTESQPAVTEQMPEPTISPTEAPPETEGVTVERLLSEAYLLLGSGNEAEVLPLIQQAGDMGSSHAKCQLGVYYITGSPYLAQDYNTGKMLLVEAIQTDGTVDWIRHTAEMLDLMYSVAYDCYGSDDWDSARTILDYAAKAGHCKAQTLYAAVFCSDFERQTQLYQAASEQGYPVATYQLAINYEGGVGIAEDNAKAGELFLQAATELSQIATTSDDPRVVLTAGWCYYYGDAPFYQDFYKAAECFAKAAELGDPWAAYLYADLILDGFIQGTPDQVLKNLTRAANAGHPDALYTMGYLLYVGEVVGQDTTKAYEYIQMAADRGHPYAELFLEDGIMFVG